MHGSLKKLINLFMKQHISIKQTYNLTSEITYN